MFIIPPTKQKTKKGEETQKREEKYINTLKPSCFFSLNEIQISQRIKEIPKTISKDIPIYIYTKLRRCKTIQNTRIIYGTTNKNVRKWQPRVHRTLW